VTMRYGSYTSDIGKIGKELNNKDSLASPEWIVEWKFTRQMREDMKHLGQTDPSQTATAQKLVELNRKDDMYRIVAQGRPGQESYFVIRYYSEMYWLLRFLCRLTASLEITVHPVYRPSPAELADATLYCANVQSYIEKALLCGTSNADDDCVDVATEDIAIRVVDLPADASATTSPSEGQL